MWASMIPADGDTDSAINLYLFNFGLFLTAQARADPPCYQEICRRFTEACEEGRYSLAPDEPLYFDAARMACPPPLVPVGTLLYGEKRY